MKLTKREKALLIGALTIIAITVFALYFYLPLQKDIKAMEEKSLELTLNLQSTKAKTAQLKQLETELKELESELVKEHSDILKIWDQAELLVFVEDTIDRHCSKESIDFFDSLEIGNISNGSIGLKIRTNYKDLQNIWSKLENAKYFNSLMSFEVIKTSDVSDDYTSILNNNEAGGTQLEVFMSYGFYSQNISDEFPEVYHFVNGGYGKRDIFQ